MFEEAQKECSKLYPDYSNVPVTKCAKCVANSLCGKESSIKKKEDF